MIAARSRAGVLRQAGNAASAALTARSTPASPASAMCPMTRHVAGSRTSSGSPPSAGSSNRPLTNDVWVRTSAT